VTLKGCDDAPFETRLLHALIPHTAGGPRADEALERVYSLIDTLGGIPSASQSQDGCGEGGFDVFILFGDVFFCSFFYFPAFSRLLSRSHLHSFTILPPPPASRSDPALRGLARRACEAASAMHMEREEHGAAIELLESLIGAFPGDGALHERLGMIHLSLGNATGATRSFAHCESHGSADARAGLLAARFCDICLFLYIFFYKNLKKKFIL
jgi:hypothetical protein